VGSSYSGQDITRELSQVANQVFLSCTNPSTLQLQQATIKEVVTILPQIHSFNQEGSVLMMDGSLIQVSHVIFATGYNYSFPFLKLNHDTQSELITDGKQVFELYLHMYYRHDPSLVFIGLPRQVVPFHLMEYQVEHAVAYRMNRFVLPGVEEMTRVEEEGGIGAAPLNQILPTTRHNFGADREFLYCDFLAEDYGGLKVPEWRRELRRRTAELRIRALGY
jgi:cation diffusion facilitator CzcD-associated flavoprotein CzcO